MSVFFLLVIPPLALEAKRMTSKAKCLIIARFSTAARHIADQLLRSSTSVAANYAEASESESAQDFVHKMKLALKELKESRVWLLFASRMNPSVEVEALKQEAQELILMISSSIATAKKRLK